MPSQVSSAATPSSTWSTTYEWVASHGNRTAVGVDNRNGCARLRSDEFLCQNHGLDLRKNAAHGGNGEKGDETEHAQGAKQAPFHTATTAKYADLLGPKIAKSQESEMVASEI